MLDSTQPIPSVHTAQLRPHPPAVRTPMLSSRATLRCTAACVNIPCYPCEHTTIPHVEDAHTFRPWCVDDTFNLLQRHRSPDKMTKSGEEVCICNFGQMTSPTKWHTIGKRCTIAWMPLFLTHRRLVSEISTSTFFFSMLHTGDHVRALVTYFLHRWLLRRLLRLLFIET